MVSPKIARMKGGVQMKPAVAAAALICALACLCACGSKKSTDLRFSGFAFGVAYEVSAEGEEVTGGEFDALCLESVERIKKVEQTTDMTDPLSDVYRFNASEAGVEDAGDMLQELLSEALVENELTYGGYDPAIGALTDLWTRSRETGAPPDVRVEVALSHSGQELVGIDGEQVTKADEKLWLDLGGIRRGFALEEAIRCLDNSALEGGTARIGDTVGYFGTPKDGNFTYVARDHLGREFAKAAVAGGYVSRVVNDFDTKTGVSSIIDPTSGKAVSGDVKCVIVRADDGVTADAFAYAFAVTSSKRTLEIWHKTAADVDALIVTDDGTLYATGRFAAEDALETLVEDYHLIRIKDK